MATLFIYKYPCYMHICLYLVVIIVLRWWQLEPLAPASPPPLAYVCGHNSTCKSWSGPSRAWRRARESFWCSSGRPFGTPLQGCDAARPSDAACESRRLVRLGAFCSGQEPLGHPKWESRQEQGSERELAARREWGWGPWRWCCWARSGLVT